jgi:hypothetical protein
MQRRLPLFLNHECYRFRPGPNANSASFGAALSVGGSATTVKWGTGGSYTKGSTTGIGGGTDIGSTDDTLVATP